MHNGSDKKTLRRLTQLLLDSGNRACQMRPEVLALTDLLKHSSQFQMDLSHAVSDGETYTKEGLAVSPMMAAMCADDYMRTIMFIRGLNNAISRKLETAASVPINVLYVGCGPFALQVVPLMTLYCPSQVQFTMLDIHQSSLDSVKHIVKNFSLQDSVNSLINTDAANYVIPQDAIPDVIVMEIMQCCLHKEPQAMVSRHLIEQAPMATLVPQKIAIELALVNISDDLHPERDLAVPFNHSCLGEAFTLCKSSILQWQKEKCSKVLPGKQLTIPANIEQGYQLMLKTKITVFEEHVLQNYESGLTTPKPLSGYMDASACKRIQFSYMMGTCPTLVAQPAH